MQPSFVSCTISQRARARHTPRGPAALPLGIETSAPATEHSSPHAAFTAPMAARHTAQQGPCGRRRQTRTWLCIAVSLLALHRAQADTVTHQAGRIAVDPTSGEDSSVELNQKTQLGQSSGTAPSGPAMLNGVKVTSANLNQKITNVPSASMPGGAVSSVSSNAATENTPAAAAASTLSASAVGAAGVNSGTQQLVKSAGTTSLGSTMTGGSAGGRGTVTGMSGGGVGATAGGLGEYLGGGATSGAAGAAGAAQLSQATQTGKAARPAAAGTAAGSTPVATERITSLVGGRKLKL